MALSENLLPESTRDSLLMSADTGVGAQCFHVHPPVLVGGTAGHPSTHTLIGVTQRSEPALSFSSSQFTPNTKVWNKPVWDLPSLVLREGDLLKATNSLTTLPHGRRLFLGDSSEKNASGEAQDLIT